MKNSRIVSLSISIFLSAVALRAQVQMPVVSEDEAQKRSYPVAGSHLLWKQEEQVREYLRQHPNALAETRLQKKTGWNFVVGSTKPWYAVDFTTTNYNRYPVPSTCRAVGNHCYIFVEDTSWQKGYVTQASVDSVKNAFDFRTPANPAKGVYQMDVEAFGNPPDVDADSLIIILILDIKDGWSGSGGFVEGYFSSNNELPTSQDPQSNVAEIYFLDAHPTNLTSTSGLASAMSTTAHEFQHMIHFNYITGQETFINEGCSLVAEVNCGYPIYNQSLFTGEPNHYLFDWRRTDNTAVLRDYSRAARYATYLRDQFTMGLFKPLLASGTPGISGVNTALQAVGSLLQFTDVLKNWFIANILDDRTVYSSYGYIYPGLPKVVPRMYYDPNVLSTSSTVQRFAAEYLSFKTGSQLRATFILPANSTLLIKAVEIGPSSKRVLDVTAGVEFSEPGFGSTYTEVDFVVINLDQSNLQTYTFQASGNSAVVEQKWDQLEPQGLLRLSYQDTVCVTFDAVPGAKLDSIRVALRRPGSITAGVYRYTGAQRPSPLGQPLAVPITASTDYDTPTPNAGTTYPYPIPYPNWRGVDLRSYSIDISQPFAVAFVIGTDSLRPGIMVTKYPGGDPFHSFTYAHIATNGPNWYYYTATVAGDSIWMYLIRAYASFTPVGVTDKIELIPKDLQLSQNYPNPFNPSTNIEFTVPEKGRASLKVYNALGQEVGELFNDEAEVGKMYRVRFDALRLPTGVYFARLESGGKLLMTKMLLLR